MQIQYSEIYYHGLNLSLSSIPLLLFTWSVPTYICSLFFLSLSYSLTVRECVIKMFFTALFHVVSLDKQMKYCPDFYVLAMFELKNKYIKLKQKQNKHYHKQYQNHKPIIYIQE
jgi:hypothetical protein